MELPLAFNAELFVQLLVNGLTLGSLYALIALGYSMVYGILKLLNFAHGDVYMIGAFIGYGILTSFDGPLAPSIAVAPLISALGVSFFLQNSALLLFGAQFRAYDPFLFGGDPELFTPGPLIDPVFTVAGIPVQTVQ